MGLSCRLKGPILCGMKPSGLWLSSELCLSSAQSPGHLCPSQREPSSPGVLSVSTHPRNALGRWLRGFLSGKTFPTLQFPPRLARRPQEDFLHVMDVGIHPLCKRSSRPSGLPAGGRLLLFFSHRSPLATQEPPLQAAHRTTGPTGNLLRLLGPMEGSRTMRPLHSSLESQLHCPRPPIQPASLDSGSFLCPHHRWPSRPPPSLKAAVLSLLHLKVQGSLRLDAHHSLLGKEAPLSSCSSASSWAPALLSAPPPRLQGFKGASSFPVMFSDQQLPQ